MASNIQNSKIAMTIQNTSSATADLRSRKRKFEEYATPPKWEYYERPEEPKEQPVEQLILAGSLFADILTSACQLTNEVHPIFADENLCFCECASDWRCVAPSFAAKTPEGIPTKVTQKKLLPHGRDNLVLDTIFQLASQMITHRQTLPFWAGLINAVVYRDEDEKLARPRSERREKFTVHPTKLLHPEHEKHTLQRLANFGAQKIRMHFREFVDDEGKPDHRCGGYNALIYVLANDPAYKKQGKHHHAWRDGKSTIEGGDRPFLHVFINLRMSNFLGPHERYKNMTISELKIEMFTMALNICHELAHTVEEHHGMCQTMPQTNDEPMTETSLENFLLGGVSTREKRNPRLDRWPSPRLYAQHKSLDGPMQAGQGVDMGPDRRYPLETRQCAVFLDQAMDRKRAENANESEEDHMEVDA